ncbi:MAG: UDPGP type 1 family protein [Parasporobacterium sp.]|nr:UDPGP type 1 family protein [Parasporobacterium sp.]
MNYEQAMEKLNQYGQTQILRFYEELNEEQKASLLDQIEKVDFNSINLEPLDAVKGNIEPLGAMKLAEIAARKEELKEAGLKSIRDGKVAALLLAGGQGTRLGLDGPKGTLNVGLTKELYIFQCLINNLMDVVNEAGVWIPLFIMTSDKNDAATRAFLKEHDYFGYNSDYIRFFVQEMAPATDFEGKVYLEAKDHIALSPNGNGGWYKSMQTAGYEELLDQMGIEWINIFAVDNVLQRIADPVFVGATVLSGCEVGAKVISKAAPDEKVGVMCYRNGRPSIVEYYDLNETMMYQKDENGDYAYNSGVILNYLFRTSALKRIADMNMPLHIAKKKIPYVDENGVFIKPEEVNGNKYESLVLDMIEMMEGCLAFEVERAKEFAPIKNMHGVDSLDSAREMLQANGIEL